MIGVCDQVINLYGIALWIMAIVLMGQFLAILVLVIRRAR